MTTYTALYVNPWPHRGDAVPSAAARQAQLIACRLYAVGCGYSVHSVHANLDARPGQEKIRQVCLALLDLVQQGPTPMDTGAEAGESGGDLVVVVYDVRDLLDKEGGPDPIARMIAACGVRVESALPPHTAMEINGYFPATALPLASAVIRGLLRRETDPSAGLPNAAVSGYARLDSAAGGQQEAVAPEPIPSAVWEEMLGLLGDEDRLRTSIARQHADAGARAFWMDALDAARRAEAEENRRRNVLLDLLLEGKFDRQLLTHRLGLAEMQMRTLRQERRTAQAHVAACELPPATEDLLVEVGRHLLPVLQDAEGIARERIARHMQVHVAPGHDGSLQASCLLPLVDESQEVEGLIDVPADACPLHWSADIAGAPVAAKPLPPAGGAA